MVASKKKAVAECKTRPVPTAERWTETRRRVFLAELGQTASVVEAARIAGVPDRSPYNLRRTDAAFRAAWDFALEEAYAKLELLLLQRATYGEPLPVEGQAARVTSSAQALALLKAHHSRARLGAFEAPRPMRGAGLREALERKLAAIDRRARSNG